MADTNANLAPMTQLIPALRFRWLTRFFDKTLTVTLPEKDLKQRLVEQAAIAPGHAILDVGSGTGTLAIMIKRSVPGARVVGLDGDPEILEIARRKAAEAGAELELREGMSFAMPFATTSFDRVVSSLVFHHLTREDKRRTLAEMRRVLRPGGELHILDWGKAANPLMRLAYVSIQLLDGFATTSDNVRGDLIPLMREAGFTAVEETMARSTIFGTLSIYRAEAPRS